MSRKKTQAYTEEFRREAVRRSDQCALLRIAKKFGRGVLPDEWYEVWADLGCS